LERSILRKFRSIKDTSEGRRKQRCGLRKEHKTEKERPTFRKM
jgi:hypothetical protein